MKMSDIDNNIDSFPRGITYFFSILQLALCHSVRKEFLLSGCKVRALSYKRKQLLNYPGKLNLNIIIYLF